MPVRTIDLLIADPPYNYGVEYADDPTGDKVDPQVYWFNMEQTIFELSRLLKLTGTLIWICPAEHGRRIWEILEYKLNMVLVNEAPIIWYETFSQYQDKQLTVDYRNIFIASFKFAPKTPVFNPNAIRETSERQRLGDKRANPAGRVPGMVWKIRRLQGTSVDRVDWHKAQLPPELYQRLILGWSNPGDLVMDAFAGSGTCGVECTKLGRTCLLVDQSPTYLNKIKERLNGK